MNPAISNLIKYIPLIVGLSILCIGSFFVPWREVLPYFSRLSSTSYISIAVLGGAYYLARIFRYYYMLGLLGSPRTLRQTAVSYFIAQPISLLPAGEMYRIIALKEHGNVPTTKGISVVFVQSLTESIALVLLALISALYLNQDILIILALLLLYGAVFVLTHSRRTAEKSSRFVNRFPFIHIPLPKFLSFLHKNRTLLSGKSLVALSLSGFVSSIFAVALLYILARDLDIDLNLTEATIAFALPTVLQNVTFLPGGIGVNEQSTIGILVLLGSPLPAAVALTLIMRFVTLILGVILGLISFLFQERK